MRKARAERRSSVINETMAKKLWPGADAVGRRFRLVETEPAEWFTVIGVAPDIRMFDMDDDTPDFSVAYVPYRFSGFANIGVTIRAAGDPRPGSRPVRNAIRASDPGLPIFSLRTMEDLRREGFWQFRCSASCSASSARPRCFSPASASTACCRSRCRSARRKWACASRSARAQADGARPGRAPGRHARDDRRCSIGLIGAFGITRVISSLLYNVTPTDPISFGGVALFLAAIAVVASYLPARRATNVDPIVALRNE